MECEHTLEGLTAREATALGKRLRRMRSPLHKTFRTVKLAGEILLAAYLINAGARAGILYNSPMGKVRIERFRAGAEIVQTLQEDTAYRAMTGGYIKVKEFLDKDFHEKIERYRHLDADCKSTDRPYQKAKAKIFNPFAKK